MPVTQEEVRQLVLKSLQADSPELMDRMKAQCERFGATFLMDEVESIDLSQRPFKIKPGYGEEQTFDAVIIATGASARYLGLPN